MAGDWLSKAGGLIVFVILLSDVIFALDQNELDSMANNLVIRYDVMKNTGTDTDAKLTLTNKGSQPIAPGNWGIYCSSVRIIEPKKIYNGGAMLGSSGLLATHVNGILYKIAPTSSFKNIAPNSALVVEFKTSDWSVSRTDLMPNWYLAAEALQPRTIANTAGEDLDFVGAFNTAEKWKRYPADRYDPYTPAKRMELSDVRDLGAAPLHVIPQPIQITTDEAKVLILGTGDWIIDAESGLLSEAQYLSEKLNIMISDTKQAQRCIKLQKGDVTIGSSVSASNESYSVEVKASTNTIIITGKERPGVYYGVQSLLSMVTEDLMVVEATIKDAPRYGFRGMHIDVSRNFYPKADILQLIEVMGMYKLNKFHFHLTDDEGWRLEIPGLEELTKVGGRRCHDLNETTCVISQLGSGPFSNNGGSGYYTVADYQEILRHAVKHHVEVIPEFDTPGHAHAAVKAMDARYERLMREGKTTEAEQYLLVDPLDTSKYLSIQTFHDNAINPCMDSTFTFMEHLVREVNKLHENIQPLKIFHFGGDEVANGAWTNSSACQQLLGKPTLDKDDVKRIKEIFVERVSQITNKYGFDLGSWEDGILDKQSVPMNLTNLKNEAVYSNCWDNIWEWGVGGRAYILANAGYKVVMSQATHLYFDHPHEPDPEDRGYYWAPRFIDTRKVFNFLPDDLYGNIDIRRSGDPITKEEACGADNSRCPPLQKNENIVGMQGQLWSETVRTPSQLHSMIFPRMLALAERAWHKAEWETPTSSSGRDAARKADWEKFANTLGYKELARLDKMNIGYHIPPPGGSVTKKKLSSSNVFPGLVVQQSSDGGKTWSDAKAAGEFSGVTLTLATRSADMRRMSRKGEIFVATSGAPSVQQHYIMNMAFVSLTCVWVLMAYK